MRPLRILQVIHDYLPRHQAGSELYAHALSRELMARGHHVHVLAASFDPGRRHLELVWRIHEGVPVTEVVNNWAFGSLRESYDSEPLARAIEDVLDAVQPDVVHVHNLLNLSFRLPELAAARGIPCVATLHDFTLLCPSGGQRVHVAEEHVCTTIDTARCARCFPQSVIGMQMTYGRAASVPVASVAVRAAGRLLQLSPALRGLAATSMGRLSRAAPSTLDASALDARLAAARAVMARVDRWVAASRALADDLVSNGMPPGRIEVRDYGFPPLAVVPRRPRTGALRVGFLGTLVWHKGPHVLVAAARELTARAAGEPRGSVEVTIHGSLDVFPDYVARLRREAEGQPVRFADRFAHEDVAAILAGLDVLVVPSLWPENSPLVIHEAFQAGVAVVGSRAGGIPELVRHEDNGLLFAAGSVTELADALGRLAADEALRARLAAAGGGVTTLADDAGAWEKAYADVVAGPRAGAAS